MEHRHKESELIEILLLSAAPSSAAGLDAPKVAVARAAVVLCDRSIECADDLEMARRELGPEAPAPRPLDALLLFEEGGWSSEHGALARFVAAMARARADAREGRWDRVEEALDEAEAALAAWDGLVRKEDLFDVYFLRGRARTRRGDGAAETSFRQAAAISHDVAKSAGTDADTERAWFDALRKLAVEGGGTIELTGALDGAEWNLDGDVVQRGTQSVSAGTHRVTVRRPGGRARTVQVAVLPGLTTAVAPALGESDDPIWVRARLDDAFDTLLAPPEVVSVLTTWCTYEHVDRLDLLRVEEDRPPESAPEPESAPSDRPEAAAGERQDLGGRIPTTWEEEVAAEADTRRPRGAGAHVRWIVFDPESGRFSVPGAWIEPPLERDRFRIGLGAGYARLFENHHAAADIVLGWRRGSFVYGAQLGAMQSERPYNLQPDWVSPTLYRLTLEARWAPERRIAPFVATGPMLIVPVALGVRFAAGLEARLGPGWRGEASAWGAATDVGAAWGLGTGVARVY